jgi:hypothetical protein
VWWLRRGGVTRGAGAAFSVDKVSQDDERCAGADWIECTGGGAGAESDDYPVREVWWIAAGGACALLRVWGAADGAE